MALRFQKSLGFNRCHATRARRRDGLLVNTILHVTRVEYACNMGSRAALRQDVPISISQDLAAKHRRIGNMSDRDEEAVNLLIPYAAGDHIAQFHSGYDALPDIEDILHHRLRA